MATFLIFGGAGMQGKIAARDLFEHGHSVVLADIQKEGAAEFLKRFPQIGFEFLDVRDHAATVALIQKVRPAVVVNCAEGDWNVPVYKACLDAKVHVIDLGSEIPATKEQLAMGLYFEQEGLVAITGCGSTPGVNNVALHYAHSKFDKIFSVEAGFVWDSNIKEFAVPFSIMSIVEEFTDPAPYIEDGEWKTAVPMETIEEREFREIGKQKIFLVRHPETLTFFLYNQNDGMRDVRYYAGFPDHSLNAIREFIDAGRTSKKPVEKDGKMVVPIEELSKELRKLAFPRGYKESENLWVIAEGEKDGKPKRIMIETIVHTLPGWEDAGCNIDTGMPASIIAQMIADGRISRPGSYAPGPIVPTMEFFRELRARQMDVYEDGVLINERFLSS